MNRPALRRVQIGLAGLSGFVLATFPLVAHLSGRFASFLTVNADHLFLAELFEDLGRGGSVNDWYLPYSPYFVPDWPLYGLAWILTTQETQRLALFASFQFVIIVAATVAIYRELHGRISVLGPFAAASILGFYALADVRPAAYLGAMFTHVGTFAMTLVAIALLLAFVRSEGRSRRLLVLSVVLSWLLVLSDPIFVFWFLLPATAGLLFWALPTPLTLDWRRLWPGIGHPAFLWIAVNGIVSITALPIRELARQRQSQYGIGVGRGSHPRVLLEPFRTIAADGGRFLWVVALAGVLLMIALLLRRPLLGTGTLDRGASRVLAVFIPVSVVATLVAQLGLQGIPLGPRYNMSVVLVPLMLASVIVGPRLSAATALAALPIGAMGLWWATAVTDLDADREPEFIACVREQLDRSGVTDGISSYWGARDLVVYLDDPDVNVAATEASGLPFRVNISERSFRDRYQFAVDFPAYGPAWDIDLEQIERYNGPPEVKIECGPSILWDWGEAGFTLTPFDDVGHTQIWNGCQLPTVIGVVDEESCVLRSPAGSGEGYLSFGPYVPVVAGTYRIEVHYLSEAPVGDQTAGSWNLLTRDGGVPSEVMADGPITGTGGAVETITITLVVPAGAPGFSPVMELQVLVSGSAGAEIHELRVTRSA